MHTRILNRRALFTCSVYLRLTSNYPFLLSKTRIMASVEMCELH